MDWTWSARPWGKITGNLMAEPTAAITAAWMAALSAANLDRQTVSSWAAPTAELRAASWDEWPASRWDETLATQTAALWAAATADSRAEM